MKALHALAASLSVVLLAGSAHAFHSGADYAKTVFEGGSGGIYYLGAKKERGWTCTMCHVDAPGRSRGKFDRQREDAHVPLGADHEPVRPRIDPKLEGRDSDIVEDHRGVLGRRR